MSDDSRPSKKMKTDSPGKGKMDSEPASNPYLAHLNPEPKKPLVLVPGQTDAKQQIEAEESTHSIFSHRPFTPHYYEVLTKRRQLPVQKQRQEFLDMVHKSQCVVLVGETGSGKTTQ
jgi:pre-mRNA-splicing factor ATP-dependent RNA helicase DHX15/PRP43